MTHVTKSLKGAPESFAAFIDRKSRAAAATELPPYTTELEQPDGMIAIGSP